MAKLTDKKLAKIQILIDQGFSNTEIARAIGVSGETIRKFRGGNNIVKKRKKNNGASEISRKRGDRNTRDNRGKSRKREPKPVDTDPSAIGSGPINLKEPERETGENGINFIGGKKTMGKETDPEKEWTCPSCGAEFNGTPEKCPSCGKELDWDN